MLGEIITTFTFRFVSKCIAALLRPERSAAAPPSAIAIRMRQARFRTWARRHHLMVDEGVMLRVHGFRAGTAIDVRFGPRGVADVVLRSPRDEWTLARVQSPDEIDAALDAHREAHRSQTAFRG